MGLEDIKCIVHVGYGMYGYGINEDVYDYINNKYGKETADNLLEIESKVGDNIIYMLKDNDDESRFNKVLIDAFENGDDEWDSKYRVKTGEFLVDSYDGSERNARLVF